ncbi:cyclophilin-like family protein [Halobium salinum]|uniref:Cyclophilin-like family protein n=1 Tax=Halobium salinum TaxID=1364940 RepID=A0ABD5PHW0_9EURY|nr:cyclophilin-like family protein [Halobium salinum]
MSPADTPSDDPTDTDFLVDVDDLALDATWTDAEPALRDAVSAALPVEGDAARWGEELYVRTGIDAPVEDGVREVPVGALAYWPAGRAVCLFWGPTPASDGAVPVAASPVGVFATVDDVSGLDDLDGGARLRLRRSD